MLEEIYKQKLSVIFFRSSGGREPVKEWLKKLSKKDKQIIAEEIKTVQFGWPIGMPIVRQLNDGLKEIRVHLTGKRICRIIFLIDKKTMVLLHGFIKKSQKMPLKELEICKARKMNFENEEKGYE